MGLVAMLGWLVLVIISGVLLFLTYNNWKLKRKCRANGVPYVGVNLSRLFQFLSGSITLPEMELQLYSECVKVGGSGIAGYNDMFVNLAYYVTDLDLTRLIYIKDFDHFVDRRKLGVPDMNKDDLFLKMLISIEGDHWKGVRAKLSPTFTTGKIRRMFGIFEKSSERMCDYLRSCVGKDGGETDICEGYSKYAMDVIASCAFGVESKAFEGNVGELSEFEKMAQLLQFKISPLVFIKIIFFAIATRLASKMGVTPLDTKPQKYFRHVIKSVMKQRRESSQRKEDFLQLMMDAQEGLLKESKESLEVMRGSEEGSGIGTVFDSPKVTLDDDDIAANCILFILAGFDTTQSLLIFAAYMLALEQNAQERLLKEVTTVMDKNGGKLEYDDVHQMQYLDLFINETLRYFPPAGRTERLCTKDYKVPGMDVVIEKGSLVSMSVFGMHRDPKYYTDPEKFDPERFLPERKSERHPYSFAPFGHGPRNCIGMRFALTEVKTIIATLVYNFKLEPGKKTDIPMKFQSNASLKPANGMWLKISPRRKDA